MISRETFCNTLRMIAEQGETDRKFSEALALVGDGHYVFGGKNKYYAALIMVLKEAVNDRYDYIDWWLYEGEPNYRVWSDDERQEWCLREPEALCDFIQNECQ